MRETLARGYLRALAVELAQPHPGRLRARRRDRLERLDLDGVDDMSALTRRSAVSALRPPPIVPEEPKARVRRAQRPLLPPRHPSGHRVASDVGAGTDAKAERPPCTRCQRRTALRRPRVWPIVGHVLRCDTRNALAVRHRSEPIRAHASTGDANGSLCRRVCNRNGR